MPRSYKTVRPAEHPEATARSPCMWRCGFAPTLRRFQNAPEPFERKSSENQTETSRKYRQFQTQDWWQGLDPCREAIRLSDLQNTLKRLRDPHVCGGAVLHRRCVGSRMHLSRLSGNRRRTKRKPAGSIASFKPRIGGKVLTRADTGAYHDRGVQT